MSHAGLISVVIPTHNRWRLLERTLAGALHQEGVQFEVVVVDDGSSDDTPARLAALDDPRLRVCRHDPARGVAAARNTGIAAARGEWLAFLDDDDLWSPSKLRVQLEAAVAQGRQWVLGGAIVVDADRNVIGCEAPRQADQIPRLLLTFNAVPGGCSDVMARTELVRRVGGFDERFRILADWDLWLGLNREGPPAVSPGFEMAYVKHAQNMTVTALAGAEQEIELLKGKHGQHGLALDDAWFSRWLAGGYRRSGRRGPAIRLYLGHAIRARSIGSVIRAMGALAGERAMRLARARGRSEPTASPAWLALYERPGGVAARSRSRSTNS